MEKLPQQSRVELTPPALSDNLVGLIQGVHTVLAESYGQVLPDHLGLDELLAVSAVAFKNYVYERDFNQLENPQPFSKLGEFVCNYGPFESLSYYTGWDIKNFNEIGRDDLWKLVRYEVAEGRPVVSLDTSKAARPMLIVGYQDEPRKKVLEVVEAGSERVEELDITTRKDLQEDEPSFVNWIVIARPSEQPEWVAPRVKQRLRAIRWAVTHAERHKEFSQETRENYGPGLRGYESFLGILERMEESEAESWGADDRLTDYIAAHVDGLRLARRAAARRLPQWSADFLSDSELEVDDRKSVEGDLNEAADAYERISEKLGEWQDEWGGGELASDEVESLRRHYSEACKAEEEAVEALKRAVKLLPTGF